jgi:hypothetical protein
MEYVVKNLSDGFIEKYLHSVIDSAVSTDLKVDSVKSLIDDVINEHKTMDKILNSNEKLSATWNNKGGSITLGQDTLIAEDNRTFEKLFNKVFENRSKLESIVDRICSDRASEISNRVLEKLNYNPLEDYFNKKDEKLEKLEKQLDYFKFKSDLEDGLLDSDTIMDSALESDNEQINLLASQYILNKTLKELNILDEFEELKKELSKE